MEKNLPLHLQEIIFGSSIPSVSKVISKLLQDGKLRKLAPRLYSGNLQESPESIIERNLFRILGHLFPGAVLSHRSAFEFKPTTSGHIFLTYKYTKKAYLPGITIRLLEGRGPYTGDNKFFQGLYVSQKARAFLENLQVSRKPGPESKTLTLPEIEERLEQIARINGENELNKIRDRAREISIELMMVDEFNRLDRIIGALLSTKSSRILKSPLASARAFGIPYDPDRLELFEILFRELKQYEFRYLRDPNSTIEAFRNFSFFESYFSNYIEGIKFEVEEAKRIIDDQEALPTRYEDSHDILGTYMIVSNEIEMEIIPESSDDFINILEYRHSVILSKRPSVRPGKFKELNNFAGQTAFVDKDLVRGTLIKSFDIYNALDHPFARAAFMMFMVSEIHPFNDGNGRIARIMMNAELVHQKQTRILIPTVYRDDYLLALRKLSRQKQPDSYIRMLSKIWEYCAIVPTNDIQGMQEYLEETNAFLESDDGRLKFQ